MKHLLLCLISVLMFSACTSHRINSDERLISVRFKTDPLDHTLEEAIDQLEFTATPASAFKISRLPHDWSASFNSSSTHRVATCSLTAEHASSALSTIRELDNVIFLRVAKADLPHLKVSAKIWTTRGPEGPGRIVTLDTHQFILK